MTWLIQFRDWRDRSLVKEEKDTLDEAMARGQELMDTTELIFVRQGDTLGWDSMGYLTIESPEHKGQKITRHQLVCKLYIKELP